MQEEHKDIVRVEAGKLASVNQVVCIVTASVAEQKNQYLIEQPGVA